MKKYALTKNARAAMERFRLKAFRRALRLDKFGPQMEVNVADLSAIAWAAGYFYAKMEYDRLRTTEGSEGEMPE